MTSVEISIANLAKTYGSHHALRDFHFESGTDWRCLGIVGRNGAGKSTLLRILMGLLNKSSGTIQIKLGGATLKRPAKSFLVLV